MVIVSLTTTPPNFYHIAKYAEELIKSQTVAPDYIVINIPAEYNRDVFCMDNFELIFKSNHDRIIVNECYDIGPATKILGLLNSDIYESIQDTDSVIVIDDDIIYPEAMIEEYLRVLDMLKDPEEIMLGVSGCNLEYGYTDHLELENAHLQSVNMVQGWSSYRVSGKILKHLENAVSIHVYPDHTFYQDDIFISNFVRSAFDIKLVHTKNLWAHKQYENGIVHNEELCVNPNVGDSSIQMHNDKSISGGSGRDGNLKKNILSLGFLIRKGLINFNLSDHRKIDILIHDFCLRNFDTLEESRMLDLQRSLFNYSVDESIEFLDAEEKSINCTKIISRKINNANIENNIDDYTPVCTYGGIDRLIETAQGDSNFIPLKRMQQKNVAVIFHVVINGGHGCYTRVLDSIRAIKESTNCKIDFYTKAMSDTGLKEQDELLREAGVSTINIFRTDSENGTLCEKWSKYLMSEVSTDDYDFVLVHYEHLVTEEFLDSLDPKKVVIDSSDDAWLSSKIQEYMSENENSLLNESRHIYRYKRRTQPLFKKPIPRWFISREEFETRGCELDCFIPHVVSLDFQSDYSGNPIFLASDNVFNIHAIKNLDSVISTDVDVYGRICDVYKPKNSRLKMRGYVEDISQVYKNCPYSINPVTLGTGSKIKIQESLGYGVPVVSMIDNGLNSGIVHMQNGFLCNSYYELGLVSKYLRNGEELKKLIARTRQKQVEDTKNQITILDYMKMYWGTYV